MAKVIWSPQPRQYAFMQRPEYECLYGGAAGGGKSDTLINEALRQVEIPNYRGLILRRTFPQLEALISRSREIYPKAYPTARYIGTDYRWEFPSGATIFFGSMQREDDKYKYQGKPYERAFGALYGAGKVNLGLDRISGVTDALTAGMSESTKASIWQAGRNSAARTITPGAQRQTVQKLSREQRSQIRILDELGKNYGIEFDIVDSIGGGGVNAAYTGGRRIVVALDAAEQAYVQAGAHEIVHYIRSSDADAYEVLRDVVTEHLAAADGFDMESAVSERIRQYAAQGEALTREGALEEIIAEGVPTVFTDAESMRALVQKNRTLAEKIRDFFVEFAGKIREIAERYVKGADREEIRSLMGKTEALTEIANVLDAALEVADEARGAKEGGETQFSRRKSKDADDISKWSGDSQFLWQHLSAKERGIFRNALGRIGNIKPARSAEGEYIIEAGHSLVYTDGNAENPRVTRIIAFDTEDGTELSWIFDMVYDAEKEGVNFDEVRTVLESVFGEGIAAEYENGVRNAIQGKSGRGEGTTGRRTGEGNRSEVSAEGESKFSLNNVSSIDSLMDGDQNLSLPQDVNVKEKSIRAQAERAMRKGFSARMEQQMTGVAGKVLRETGSKYPKADMIANLRALIEEYERNGASEETARAVSEMAKKIIEGSSRVDKYADLRKKMRETAVSLTETQKQEAANEAGSYDAYRRNLFGTVKLTAEGISLDNLWGELSSQYPEIFPADTGEGEMVGKLTDFAMMMKPKYENPYGMDMDGAALEMGMRIQGDIMGIIGAKDAAQAMYGNAEKIRKGFEKEFKEKLARQKKERVEKFQQIASDLKAAKAKGDSAEQAKIMNRYRAAMKATALEEAYAEVRATYREREAQKAENRKRNEMRARVTKQANELMKMFVRPEKGKRIPTGLQGLVLDVLETLDINGERAEAEGRQTQKAQEFREKLNGIRKFYEDVMNSQGRGEAPEGLDGLMMAFSERNLENMQEALEVLGSGEKFLLREMNSEQLRSLDELLKNIRHTVDSVGKLWKIRRYQSVAELGDASIAEMDSRREQKYIADSAAGKARDFMALDMMEPVSYGERLGEGGQTIIQNLLDGEKEKFSKVRAASEATQEMMEAVGITGYDIGRWKKHVQEVKLGSGRIIKMTDAQLMSLYLTAKRPQGMRHLLGSGMRIPDTKQTGAQVLQATLTRADIEAMGKRLTDEQRGMAERMQEYLSGDVAKWGNDVTQRMYLYDAFTEKNYWPISSDPNNLKTQEPEGERAFNAIVNAGFTKPVNRKANNPVIISDAFDVFGGHISEMASYAGYAEVMTDTLAWINYRQRTEDGRISGGVKQSIERLLGKGGVQYLTKLVQDINGTRRSGDGTQITSRLLSNYKKAAVAGKIRVAIQQPTSIVRAAAEIHPVYLMQGLKAGRGAVEEMQKYSSLAWWKGNGNYDIGIGKGTDAILWGDTEKKDAVMDKIATGGGLIDPGKMDDWAWARMWSAVKREVSRTRKDLTVGSEEYFRAVTERFEYIMDRTQVVDTVMHRSDMMRSKDGLIQTLTAFKAEPTKSYNMLMRAIMEAGRNPKDRKAYAKVMRTTGAFVVSSAATAAATALFDAFKNRDDEDDIWTYLTGGEFGKDYQEALLSGFAGNVNLLSSIPLAGEALDALQGNDVTMMQFEGLGNIANAVTTFYDHFFGENTKKTTQWGAMKPALTTISQLAGLPVSGMIANGEFITRIFDPKIMQTKSEMATMSDAYMTLYKAMRDGDSKKALSIRTELAKGLYGNEPKNPKEIDTQIAHILAQEDERVMRAYEMRTAGNRTKELVALKKQIMADGFTDEQVTAAINYCETLLKTEKEEKDMTAQLTARLFGNDDLLAAVRNGDTEDVAAVAEYLEANSTAADPAKTIRSAVSGEFKQEYIDLVSDGKDREARALAEKLEVVGITEEDREEWIKDSRYSKMKTAVEEGDGKEAKKQIDALLDSGSEVSSVVSSLNGQFREVYVSLMKSGKRSRANLLRETLQGLGLYWKDGKTNYYRDEIFNEWLGEEE